METWAGLAVVIIFNVGFCFYLFGKLEQKVKDSDISNVRQMVSLEKDTGELFGLVRQHEQADQRHFNDTDVHWNRRERDWLNTRFEEIGKRFDTIEAMIRNGRE